MHVSKLDAAKSQLETAIRIFFANGDPVAIHTLASAARTLLQDLIKAEGRSGEGFEAKLLDSIVPERRDEVRSMLVEAQNFFKHADRDPDEVYEFRPATTAWVLWEACLLYTHLTSSRPPLAMVFNTWFSLAHPAAISDREREGFLKAGEHLDLGNRPAFLAEMLPWAERFAVGELGAS